MDAGSTSGDQTASGTAPGHFLEEGEVTIYYFPFPDYSLDEVSLDSAHLTPALSVPRKPSKCDSHATTTQGHSANSSPKRYLLKDALTLTPGSARHCWPRGGFAGNLGWGSGMGDAGGQDPARRLPLYAGVAESFSLFLWASVVKRVQ